MPKNKLHMIGHAHIDPVWLWPWQEGFHEARATFRSALDRMKEYDDFTFVASSAAFYEWVEKSDLAMFAEIQQRVAEGRWGRTIDARFHPGEIKTFRVPRNPAMPVTETNLLEE